MDINEVQLSMANSLSLSSPVVNILRNVYFPCSNKKLESDIGTNNSKQPDPSGVNLRMRIAGDVLTKAMASRDTATVQVSPPVFIDGVEVDLLLACYITRLHPTIDPYCVFSLNKLWAMNRKFPFNLPLYFREVQKYLEAFQNGETYGVTQEEETAVMNEIVIALRNVVLENQQFYQDVALTRKMNILVMIYYSILSTLKSHEAPALGNAVAMFFLCGDITRKEADGFLGEGDLPVDPNFTIESYAPSWFNAIMEDQQRFNTGVLPDSHECCCVVS